MKITPLTIEQCMENGLGLPKGTYDDELMQRLADKQHFYISEIETIRRLTIDYMWGTLSKEDLEKRLDEMDNVH